MELSEQHKKDIDKKILALFLLMLSYKKSYYYKALMNKYKINRDILKDNINRVYAKYSVNGELKISYNDLNSELNKIDKELKNIAKDLYYTENVALMYLLKNTYHDSYYKSSDILIKYIDVKVLKQLSDKVVNNSINREINGLTINQRNKSNKETFVNKVSNDVKVALQFGKTIDVINQDVDKRFNESATVSDRLIGNEIVRVFNESIINSYKTNGIRKVMWNSALEDNTCDVCASRDGEVYGIDDAPMIPEHTNCKCYYSVVE